MQNLDELHMILVNLPLQITPSQSSTTFAVSHFFYALL
jgi:hypothetical protein